LDNLLARVREYCSEYTEEIDILFSIDYPEKIPNIIINNQAHRNIFLTIKEALQNTIKHSLANTALLEIKIENNSLFVKFKDNGKGFNIDKNRSLESNGLLNMRHRIETIGGKYTISSVLNEGTEIVFEIKLEDIDYKITL
jgi:signal transduction histidine kinase